MSDSDEEEKIPWPLSAICVFVFIGILIFFWPHLIKPFRFFEFWTPKGDFFEAVKGAWPWYLWGFSITLILLIFREIEDVTDTPSKKFIKGIVISLWAGIVEEMAFRWLFFFSAIVTLPVFNFLFGGFMGLELIRWIYQYLLCPFANCVTFGLLEPYLLNGYGWAIGAAVIIANSRFRNEHVYQGPLGWVNSWFFGMYMYWIMFKYGILPAMFIHFLYDLIIFTMEAIYIKLKR